MFVIFLKIRRILEPIEVQNFRCYIDNQIGNAIDITGKDIFFIEQIPCKFFYHELLLNLKKDSEQSTFPLFSSSSSGQISL